ncbi:MAG: four-carbon acid sugar kinase family protein [Lacrimispora sp.]|uniref:four-carbon acid sugar kinase family protein n=1 Tax=Lacrimispora sp. TaxID=2719234 RepID=UPI0039E2B86A
MVFLLIIADDFTGALDTGVQFAAHGIRTRVVVEPDVDFNAHEAKVLVVDTETRHLPASQAYGVVAKLTGRAQSAGVSYIYKKTDSALRGNIGAELSALLRASGCRYLPFLPAFPQTGRITRGGVHYVDGVPVTESPFGIDPFDPVKHSVVTDLIAQQCDLPVRSFPALAAGDRVPQDEGIMVFDASDDADLYSTGCQLLDHGGLHIMAGCAGFGAVLPELLGIAAETHRTLPKLDPRLLVVCGSVNPITLAQLDRAENAGFTRLRLTPDQKLEPGYWQSKEGREELTRIGEMLAANPHCIIDTNDPGGNRPTADYAARLGIDRETLRVRIAGSLGHLVGEIFPSPSLGTLLLTGGDTLLQCMSCVGVRELEPLCELENGVVLASFTHNGCTRHVITKSGGFGQESLLTDLAARIARH